MAALCLAPAAPARADGGKRQPCEKKTDKKQKHEHCGGAAPGYRIAAVNVTLRIHATSPRTARGLSGLDTIFDISRTETIRGRFGARAAHSDPVGAATLLSVPAFPRPVDQSGTAKAGHQGVMQTIDCAEHSADRQPFSVLLTPRHGGFEAGLNGIMPPFGISCMKMGSEPYVSVTMPLPKGGLTATVPAGKASARRIVIPVGFSASGHEGGDITATWAGTITLAQ